MNPDDRMHAALRAVADEPAPPAVTTLDQVITKGRRRVLVQRGATVAAVVGVVAAIGVGGVVLRSAAEGQGARPAGPPSATATTTTPGVPSVPTTGNQPPETTGAGEPSPTLLPGWHWVGVPADRDVGDDCKGGMPAGTAPDLSLPPKATVTETFLDAVGKAAGHPTLVDNSWEGYSPKTKSPHGFLDANVDMGDGPGSIQLEVDHFGGTPEAAADADLGSYGSCAPPSRTTLDDGTVLQLEQGDWRDPKLPMQHLRVYQPNGRLYIVTTAGYGKSDLVPADGEGYTITNGRGRLPVDAAGIAEIALALADLGL